MDSKLPPLASFEDPTRCSMCREPITAVDTEKGLVLHVKVAPVKALHPDTGEVLGFVQPEGPANRYFHARPCAERYARRQLICLKCNFWRSASKTGTIQCLCKCHPRQSQVGKKGWPGYKNDEPCEFHDNDLERAGGL